ncbi:MAG: DUF4446 family protein [Solirubrobacteraceae bacterium]
MASLASADTSLVADGASAVAVLALLLALWLTMIVRQLRSAQRTVLGDRGAEDLVQHAAGLEAGFEALRSYVEEVAQRLDARVEHVEGRLEHTFIHRALVRYDAYNEMSGRQSLSIALLDKRHSGLVLSSIHHRDQARLYAKQVHAGEAELELSPEEEEALRLALSAT